MWPRSWLLSWSWWQRAAAIIVGSWAVTLRLYQLAAPSYWLDEGFSVTIARAIVGRGVPLLDSGEFIWRSPLYHYALAAVVTLAGDGEWATRLLSVILGLAVILVLTVCAERWFGRTVAAITFVLVSFSSWEIVWSRQARMYLALQLLFWLAVLVYTRWWQTRRDGWLVIVTSAAALATHEFAALLLLALPAYSLMQRFAKRPRHLIIFCVGLLLTLAAAVVVLRYGWQQPVPVNYWSHYSQFLWREHAVMLGLAVLGLIVGGRQQLPIIFWLAWLWLLGLGIFSFSITLLHYRYLFFLYPILIWLTAVAIAWLWQLRTKVVAVGGLLFVFGVLIAHDEISLIPKSFWELESDPVQSDLRYKSFTPQPNFRAGYRIIAQRLAEQPAALVLTPYPELSRLYLSRTDNCAIYLDLTGSAKIPSRARHRYTGAPYCTLKDLAKARAQRSLILLDKLADWRIDQNQRQFIEDNAAVIYTEKTNNWSELTVYQFLDGGKLNSAKAE